MGSSTVHGFSDRLRFQFLFLALFSLIFAGCDLEEGETTSPGSSPPLSTHTFDNKVKVRFMVPTVDGPVEVTSNDSLQRALKRAVPQPENVRAQGTPAEYVGNILTSDNGFGIYPADTSGQVEVYNSVAKAVVGAFIIDTQAIKVGYDTGTITYRYYPPSPDQGLSLSTFVTNDITSEYSVSDSSVVRAGDPVEVQVNYSWFTDYPDGVLNRVYNGTISLNGEVVFTFENVRAIGDSEFLPVTPCFASKESGTARLELTGNWGDERQTDFIQKGLEFRQETQDFELQPNQTAAIRNDFGWDLGANPDSLVQPSWEVEIVDPQKQVIKTFSGSGRQISANWTPEGLSSPIRLVPIDRFLQDGEVPVYGYRLKAKAKIGDPVFGTGSIFYELSNDPDDGKLQIVNIELDPDPPFQNEGDSVELTAEVLALGLGDLTDDDIEWWVDLLDPSGEVVGPPLGTGNGFEVAATWDGQVEGVAVEDPTAYSLRIKARKVCDGVSPKQASHRAQAVGCRLVAQANVRFSGGPLLEILQGEEILAKGLSPAALLPPIAPATKSALDERRKLLGTVQSLDWQGQSPTTLKVRLSGVTFTDENGNELPAPRELSYQVRSLVSGVTLPSGDESLRLTQEKVDETTPRTYTYSSSFPLNSSLLKSGDALGRTRYSVGEIYGESSPESLSGKELKAAVTSMFEASGFYPTPLAFLGTFEESAVEAETLKASYPNGETRPDQVTSSVDNVLATGFEAVEFKLTDSRFANYQSAVVKVAQKANRVVLNFHGGHDKGELGLAEDRNRFHTPPLNWYLFPSAALSSHFAEVKTLILSSCSVLDIGDYNNNFLSSKNGVWPRGEDRKFGGTKWDEMTGGGTRNTVLLGYNSYGPYTPTRPSETANLAVQIQAEYGKELRRLSGVSDDLRQQWAWMAANVRVAQQATGPSDARWLALNAAALDKDYYYYIPHFADPAQTLRIQNTPLRLRVAKFDTVDRDHPVYRVPRPLWEFADSNWEVNRDELARVGVEIPGLTYSPTLQEDPQR